MEFEKRLKELRIKKGLPQEELAKQLGVSRQTIYNWENGRSVPDIASAIKLGKLYGISVDTLLNGEAVMEGMLQKRRRFWQMMLEVAVILELLGQLLKGLEFVGIGGLVSWLGFILVTVALMMHLYVFDHTRYQTIRGMAGLAAHWTVVLGMVLFPESVKGVTALAVQTAVAALIWSAGVWTVDWKSTRLWLILALFFGTPLIMIGKGMQEQGILVKNTPFPGYYRVEKVIYPEKGESWQHSVVQLGENSLTLYMDGVEQDYIGMFSYCEPSLEDAEQGIWLLTPKDKAWENYRLTLGQEGELLLSFAENGQLRWQWKLKSDHRRASITVPTFGHTTSKGLTWYPKDTETEDPQPVFYNSIDVVLKGKLNIRAAGMVGENLVLQEEYHHGDAVDYRTYTLEPGKNGSYTMPLKVRYEAVEEQYAVYRIPFEDGEYRFVLTYAGWN